MENKTSISWSAADRYLQNFANYFEISQTLFLTIRPNHIEKLPRLWDAIHELWRMENPYLDDDEGKKLDVMHKKVSSLMENYRNATTSIYRQQNFNRIYKEIDEFFIEITKIAVRKGFFPTPKKLRSLDDRLDASMLQR